MMSGLPVALALSTTGFISHGDRNCPFLMLTGLPAAHTLVMKSVWRTRKAGVCSTSTTLATSSIGVYSCTSRSEEHTSELQSIMSNAYAVFCLQKKHQNTTESSCNIHQAHTANSQIC